MIKPYPLAKPLTDQLRKEVKAYGILEVSTEQYQNVCNSIVHFAQSSQIDSYSLELMDSYKNNLEKRCSSGEICKEYHRFQLRVVRMLSSLAESVIVDFSSTKSHPLKYIVSNETNSLVEKILDSFPISDAISSHPTLPYSPPNHLSSTLPITSGSIGFAVCSFIPASSAAFTSSANAFAVIAIIGTSVASGRSRARIACVASYPFITGIITSIKTIWYV